jgi:hypothetical protein
MIALAIMILLLVLAVTFGKYFPMVVAILAGDKATLYDCEVPCVEHNEVPQNTRAPLPYLDWKGDFIEKDFKE